MHENAYPNRTDEYEHEFVWRLQYARESNYQSVVLTGTGEPLANIDFIRRFGTYNALLTMPFRWIEVQTSGAGLRDCYTFLKNAGISTIALSLTNVFDSKGNGEIMEMPLRYRFDIPELCKEIKTEGFNLRLSLGLWSTYNGTPAKAILTMAKAVGADQVTFKKLYADDSDTPQAKWIREHEYKDMNDLKKYIIENGMELETLSFGATRYDIDGMSVVVDNESCLGLIGPQNAKQVRYLILRPDCHLYTRWDSKGSLLF
jgi:molybdenum cofactor biosynthesis enzyme MoaA